MSAAHVDKGEVRALPIGSIIPDRRAQFRKAINAEAVKDFAQALRDGVALPPVVVFQDVDVFYLGDGFHRHGGALEAGLPELQAEVRQGGLREARVHAAGANKGNLSVRFTLAEKRDAATFLLTDTDWSDRRIGEHCGISHPTVATLRKSLEATGKIFQSGKRVGADGKERKLSEPKAAAPAPEPQAEAVPERDVTPPAAEVSQLRTPARERDVLPSL